LSQLVKTVASEQSLAKYVTGWLLWLGFIAFLVTGLLSTLRQAPLVALVFFGTFFFLAGRAALHLGRATSAYLHFGDTRLSLLRAPMPGGQLHAVVRLTGAAFGLGSAGPRRMEAELVCTLELQVRSAGRYTTRTDVLSSEKSELALQRDSDGAFVEVRIPIPAAAKPSGDVEMDGSSVPAQRAWALRLKAAHPGGDFERSFPVEVLAPEAAGAGAVITAPMPHAAAATLIVANLLPLALVLAGTASIGNLVLLYWAENLIIGFYALLRMAAASRGSLPEKLGSMVFFSLHYGGFCLIHGLFVVLMFGGDPQTIFPRGSEAWPFPFSLAQNVAAGAEAAGLFSAAGMLLPLLALCASHGVSFVQNYLRNGRYRRVDAGDAFWRPYPRMILLHVMIIAGAWFIARHGSPLPLLVGLVAGKTLLDLLLHRRANRR
jgi:hypothetical protein